MIFLSRQPVAVLECVRALQRFGIRLGRDAACRQHGLRYVLSSNLTVGRSLSTSPLAWKGVSSVPVSGTNDSWSETLGAGLSEIAPSSDTAQTLGAGLSETVQAVGSSETLQEVAEAVQQSGQDLASLGLGAWYTPVGNVQVLLDYLHTSTGLPWWGIIGAATVVLRVLLFPLSIKFASNAATIAKIQPELAEIMKKIQHYSKIGAKEQQEKEQVKMASLYQKHNCSPLTMMTLPFMQLPFFMSFFIALRKMALGPLESMQTGGMWWFSDLTMADPTYTLPLLACGIFIVNIQLGGETGETNVMETKMRRILTIGSVCLVPITINFPTAVFMYWIPNSMLVTVQMLLLKTPAVRTALGIPLLPKRKKPDKKNQQ